MMLGNPVAARPLMTRLREETRDLHEAIESRVDLLRPDLTRTHYLQTLTRFYGFYRPLEASLLSVGGLAEACPDYGERRKVGMLEADLAALGVTEAQMTALPDAPLPDLENVAQAMGSLYVIEGATLGGAYIARHIQETLGLDAGSGCAFFPSYGERRGMMWKRLGEWINRLNGPGEQDAAVAAARETFRAFDRWLAARPR